MTEQTQYRYDVFISYSHIDKPWVRNELLPRLQAAGLKVCIDDDDFEPGTPSLVNMERAVANSRRTLVVLTPNWGNSDWTDFESLLISTLDPAGRERRVIPLLLKPTTLPLRIRLLTYLDFQGVGEDKWRRLISTLQPTDTAGKDTDAGQGGHTPPSPPIPSPDKGRTRREYLTHLREQLATSFSAGELRTLCVDLGFDYDDLPEGGKSEKAREIVEYMKRTGRIAELVEYCSAQRPHIVWGEAP